MTSFTVLLTSINDVKTFVNHACAQNYDIDLVSGRYIIDAKSIMGIFSLDLAKPIKVELHAGQEEADTFKALIKNAVVED